MIVPTSEHWDLIPRRLDMLVYTTGFFLPLCHGVIGKDIVSLLCFLKLKIQPALFSQVLECDAPGPGGSGALALVGLSVCVGLCRLAPPQRVDRLATYLRVRTPLEAWL